LIVASVLPMSNPLSATEKPAGVPEIVVEGSPIDRYLPARSSIGRPELEQLNKSELSEVLLFLPGLNVRHGGRAETRIDMRGFDQRAILFMLNGIPVYEPYNGIIDIDLFPLEMLDSIGVTRGPSSALYGPNGMAGTIQMSTLQPQDGVRGAATEVWRDSNYWDTRASAGAGSAMLSLIAGGRYLTSDGFRLSDSFNDRPQTRRRFEDGGLRLNSDREEWSAFVNGVYRYSDKGFAHATFLESSSEFGIPPGTTGFAPVFRRNDGQELLHAHVGVEQSVFDRIDLGGAVFYSDYSSSESEFDGPDFTNQLIRRDADSDEIGGIARITADIAERDTLALALQARQDGADLSDTVSGHLGDPELTMTSAAVENLFFLTESITLALGLSGDVQTGGGRGTDWEMNPQGGVSVDWERYGVSRLSISRKTRFPTLRELFDPLEGNPDLEAEKALVYEIGHRAAYDWLYGDLTLFRSDVDDLIEMETIGDLRRSVNLGEAVLQGIEAGLGGAPRPELHLDVNYTLLDAQARNDGGHDEIQHKPRHRFNGILRLFLVQDFVLRLEGVYTSDQVDQFGTDVDVDSFGLFNVSLARTFDELVQIVVGANNIFDEDYEEKLGMPQPGRWFFIGLRASYEGKLSGHPWFQLPALSLSVLSAH
jgi:outer membrane cobalamin receptor